jgi:DivIVA domain-containing protein
VDGTEDDPTGGGPGQDRAGQRFTRTRLRPGYRVADVDALMERAEAGSLTAREVETVSFRSTRLSEGYDEVEVDTALDALASRLRVEGRSGA